MRTKSYVFTQNQWSDVFDSSMDSQNTLVLVFFAATLPIENQLDLIKKTFPHSQIIGASTTGEIHDAVIYDNSIVCTVVQFQSTELKVFSAPITFESSVDVGKQIANELAGSELKNILLFTEGLDVDGSNIIKGLHEQLIHLGVVVPVTGGLASDGLNFTNSRIIFDSRAKAQHVVAVGFYGENIHIFSGVGTGWDPFGPMRTVTKSKRNMVYEIDNKPALQLYKEHLKDDAVNLPVSGILFPIGVSHNENESLVRSVAGIDEESNSLRFASHIPENTNVQLMHSNVVKLISAAENALNNCPINLTSGVPTLALIVSCVGRRFIMGQKTADEIEIIREKLPRHVEMSGFYSYGEFAPTLSRKNALHNQTMTLILFQENAV